MPHLTSALSRRLVLRGALAGAAAMAMPAVPMAQSASDALLFTLADLHSPYARLPALLGRMRVLQAEARVPAAVLINGDIFERGNVVALRSEAAADWQFLETLAAEFPVIVNLGNHETAILDDMAAFVARAQAAGVQVVSNLTDLRSGQAFAPATASLELGGLRVGCLGLAATNPFVYRQPVRDTLGFADTSAHVAEAFGAIAGADLPLILSHAGVTPDRAYIGTMPAGVVIQGAHDHLTFDLQRNGVRYVHGASWGTRLGVVSLVRDGSGVAASYRAEPIAAGGGDDSLASAIAMQLDTHLTSEDRTVLANLPQDLDMHASILTAAEAVRIAAKADIAMLSHTTFGAPLSAGPFTRYDLDAFVRFGGGIRVVTLTGTRLAQILRRANQFRAATLDARTGDYMHVADPALEPDATYTVAMNAWPAINQQTYLGTEDLEFVEMEGLELKAIVTDHLATL